MDNNFNNAPQPGAESLNERLRLAAEQARRNIAAEDAPRPQQPRQAAPQQPLRPQPTIPPQQPQQPPRQATIPPQPQQPLRPQPTIPPQQQQPRQATIPPQPQQPRQATIPPQQPQQPRRQPTAMPGAMPGGSVPPVPPSRPAKPAAPQPSDPKKQKKTLTIVIILAGLLLIAVGLVVFMSVKSSQEKAEQQAQIEQLQLQNEQIQLANEYESLNNEYAQYENQTALLANDSIVQKYAAARAQVETLLNELNNEKNKSAAQIAQLKEEIKTLKGILRTYVEQINELQKENQSLRDENAEVKSQNAQLSQTVQSVQASNEKLNERMTLAEKLNVTGVNLIPLNKKGKHEKKIAKATQLEVTFTIPQNNSTPVGEKTIYLRITSPEGDLLGNGGTFSFEGSTLRCTARKNIEYQGEEIGGIKIYWDVNATLNPGDYTVELFADNYRLASRRFTISK